MSQYGYKQVTVLWGPNYQNVLPLNSPVDATTSPEYHANTSGELMGGPDQDILIADPTYALPYDAGLDKLQPRSFSVRVQPNEAQARYDATWHARRAALLKAVYSGPIRLIVEREGQGHTGLVAIDCKCEGAPEVERGIFELKLVAPNPVFTEVAGIPGSPELPYKRLDPALVGRPGAPDEGEWMYRFEGSRTYSGEPALERPEDMYNATHVPYNGTYPSAPVISLQVDGAGRVWRYMKEFQVTNPSPTAIQNRAVCIDLGNVAAYVSGGQLRSDYGDIRVETLAGVRKAIYVRPYPDRTTGPSVKVWTILYAMQPGETKTLRLLYGNPYVTLEEENASVKPMFNMYTSSNLAAQYVDFCPRRDQPQSRVGQWSAHVPGRRNIDAMLFSHPDFTPPSDSTLVAQAGGIVTQHGVGNGYAGLELASAIPIASIAFPYRTRTNFKAPFVTRSRRMDGTWTDDYVDGTGTGNRTWMYDIGNAGDTHLDVTEKYLASLGWSTGDQIALVLDNGSYWTTTISSIDTPNNTFGRIWLAAAIPVGRSVPLGRQVTQNPTGKAGIGGGTYTLNYTVGDEPYGVMIGMRVDYPSMDLMDKWYAGADSCWVTYVAAQVPTIRWRVLSPTGPFTSETFGGGYQFDLDNVTNGYQCSGRLQNDYDGKGIRVNYIMRNLGDVLVIDCPKRECWYYEWDAATNTYKDRVNAYSGLYFEEVRDYWVKVVPDQDEAAIRFVHDAQSNFRHLIVDMRWANKFL